MILKWKFNITNFYKTKSFDGGKTLVCDKRDEAVTCVLIMS